MTRLGIQNCLGAAEFPIMVQRPPDILTID